MKTPFIWLGAGRTKRYGVAGDGKYLDTAGKAGLPIPAGGILLDAFYRLALEHELAVVRNGRVHIDDADFLTNTLYESVRFPLLKSRICVRDIAGMVSQRGIDPADGRALADGLAAVWSGLVDADESVGRDVVVMSEVEALVRGSAVTETWYDEDLVTLESGTAVRYLPQAGKANGEVVLTDWEKRLQKLLRGVARTMGDGSWTIEWADDGQICWLLQLLPLTEAPPRPDTMSREWMAAILPDLPDPFVTSVVVEASRALLAVVRQIDPVVPVYAELVEVVNGRLWFNATLIDRLRGRLKLSGSEREAGRGLGRVLRSGPQRRRKQKQVSAETLFGELSVDVEQAGFTEVANAAVQQMMLLMGQTLGLIPLPAAAELPTREKALAVYDQLAGRLIALAEVAVMHAQLPHLEALWLMDTDEVRGLDGDEHVSFEALAAREDAWQALVANAATVEPMVRVRGATLLSAALEPQMLRGRGVVAGRVAGRAWRLDAPTVELPPDFLPFETILLVSAVDERWTATCSLVAGVVVVDDGRAAEDFLREMGLPAVVGVSAEGILSGDSITVDGDAGIVAI